MTDRTAYEHGTPCWVDLMSPDPDASAAFYTALFGWTSEDSFDEDGTRIYTNFLRDGKVLAGMSAQPPEMAGMPPAWNSYVSVEDVDAVAAAVEAAGGTVMMPPMQVMDAGRMAIFSDPAGAAISIWQPGSHIGAEVVNEPNTYAWNELLSRDVDTAKRFYTDVFGWTYDAMEMPMGTYNVVRGGDEGGLAGLMAMPDGIPAEVPSYWNVYFLVADADATCARAAELGGSVAWGPDATPIGRLATVADPHGASFSIMQPAAQD